MFRLFFVLFNLFTLAHSIENRHSSSSNNVVVNPQELYPQNPLYNQIGATIQIRPDSGIPTAFAFGPSGVYAYQSLTFNIPNDRKTYILRYWDCYCSGDVLTAMENGTNIVSGQTLPPASAYSNCNIYQSDVTQCAAGSTHQVASANVGVGYHNVTFFVTRAMFQRGIAYAGVYSICGINICCQSVSNCTNLNT